MKGADDPAIDLIQLAFCELATVTDIVNYTIAETKKGVPVGTLVVVLQALSLAYGVKLILVETIPAVYELVDLILGTNTQIERLAASN